MEAKWQTQTWTGMQVKCEALWKKNTRIHLLKYLYTFNIVYRLIFTVYIIIVTVSIPQFGPDSILIMIMILFFNLNWACYLNHSVQFSNLCQPSFSSNIVKINSSISHSSSLLFFHRNLLAIISSSMPSSLCQLLFSYYLNLNNCPLLS